MIGDFKNLGLRSITFSIDLDKIHLDNYRENVNNKVNVIRDAIESHKIPIRTIRFNIIKISSDKRIDKYIFLNKIKLLSDFSKSINIRWFNISFDMIKSDKKNTANICSICYEIIKRFSNAFVNLIVSDKKCVNPYASFLSSQLILDVSKLSNNGYDNFRIGVSLNPNESTPFFPFSYSDTDLSFSIAVEITSRLIDCLEHNKNLIVDPNFDKLHNSIFQDLSPFAIFLDHLLKEISLKEDVRYVGQDLSLAPYPDSKVSVVKVLQLLGIHDIGSNGTLFFTAFLTSIIKSLTKNNNLLYTGFNGVMYSLLEDHLMCKANDKLLLDIDKIIGYSTLCGCGLDMVPIPGNVLAEEMASIILDLAATASRLEKPLGFRVLPIPNKQVNESTEFDMDFLTNTRVLGVKNLACDFRILSLNKITLNE